MKVVGFVGPSGTGKSYRALWVAKQKDIDYIIDDGLLIGNNKVIAGFSAKKELTKLGAIRRACFQYPEHVEDVRNAININNPKSILILGTSDGMVHTISKALGLEEVNEIVRISDIATEEEIDVALKTRRYEGKHVIPVPTFELKKSFSGYFMDTLKIFKKKGNTNFTAEKTVVRPTYSYLGKYTISDSVIKDITKHVVAESFLGLKLSYIEVKNIEESISITINIVAEYSKLDRSVFTRVQEAVRTEVEKLTYMNVVDVNIVLKSLDVKSLKSR